MLFPRKTWLKISLFLFLLSGWLLGYLFFYSPAPHKLKVYFFQVGEGDAIFIQTPAPNPQNILIDGGPNKAILAKLNKVLPFFQKKINFAILSHPHADHLTGLIAVMQHYSLKKIYYSGVFYPSHTYLAFLQTARKRHIKLQVVNHPFVLPLNKQTKLIFLYPLTDLRGKQVKNLNNTSLVVKLVYHHSTFLFPGDAQEEEEKIILPENIQADILKIPHQGASNASWPFFLKKVRPKIAIITAGDWKIFHHPSLRTIARLKRLKIKFFITHYQGDILISTAGQRDYFYQTHCLKQNFWQNIFAF